MRHSSKFRAIFALLFGGVLWALIIYKAIYIPVTHDEVPGPTHYCNFSAWSIMMFVDNSPNNHILNTLLTKFSMYVFGREQWAARLPNILCFGVYFFAAYQICTILFKKDTLLFLGGLALFLCNPFLLDFFSLCRGYGISSALMLCSTMFCLQAYFNQKEQAIWFSLVFSVLASYANFTLLVFWCAINMMTFLFFVNEYLKQKQFYKLLEKTGFILLGILAYGALIYTPIHKMQRTNQFDPWQTSGFFKDTIANLIENTLYGSKIIDIPADYLAFLVVAIFMTVGSVIFYQWGKKGWNQIHKMPVFIAFSVVGLTVLVNVLQTIVLHTPNLTNRTAVFFYPLFSFLMVSIIYHLANRNVLIARMIGVSVLILGILHLTRTVTLDRVREWWFDANTFQVMHTIEKEVAKENKSQVSLRTNWGFYPSFAFYTLTGKAPFLDIGAYNKAIDTTNQYDYYYVFDSDYPLLQNNYTIIEKYDGGARMLLKHK